MSDYKVYYNPSAGSGRAAKVKSQLDAGTLNINCQLSAGDYLVIGGDGTLNALLNELPHPEDYRFLLLPAGTSNSLAHSLIDTRSIDIWQLETDSHTYRFINEASVGFAAAIAREVEHNRAKRFFNRLRLSELAYIATAFRCWFTDKPYFLSLCNNRRISGDLYPCVNADFADNWLDTYELDCPRWRLPFELLRLVRTKKDKPSPFVSRNRVQEFEWFFDTPLPVEIDGNPLPPTKHIRLSRYPQQVRVTSLHTTPTAGTSSRKIGI